MRAGCPTSEANAPLLLGTQRRPPPNVAVTHKAAGLHETKRMLPNRTTRNGLLLEPASVVEAGCAPFWQHWSNMPRRSSLSHQSAHAAGKVRPRGEWPATAAKCVLHAASTAQFSPAGCATLQAPSGLEHVGRMAAR